ncbi:hypothetical protein J6590_091773 [Homalodisca vitripennis]|nr:hypothetical protein J6590_091773 [Homalodisca vitripennis]
MSAVCQNDISTSNLPIDLKFCVNWHGFSLSNIYTFVQGLRHIVEGSPVEQAMRLTLSLEVSGASVMYVVGDVAPYLVMAALREEIFRRIGLYFFTVSKE